MNCAGSLALHLSHDWLFAVNVIISCVHEPRLIMNSGTNLIKEANSGVCGYADFNLYEDLFGFVKQTNPVPMRL